MSTDTKSQLGRVVSQPAKNPPVPHNPGGRPKQPQQPPQGGRRRRGGRGRRGNRKPKGNRTFTSSSASMSLTTMPYAIASTTPSQYFRSAGPVKHKEWGEGCRFTGRSIFGTIQYSTNTARNFLPYIAQEFTDSKLGTTFALNPYNEAQDDATNANTLRDIVFSMHPALISRLNLETVNWGRYVYRNLKLSYFAICPTNNPNSYVAGLGHDVSLPLTETWMTPDTGASGGKVDYHNILNMGQSVNGASYQGFNLQAKDYKGDKTWPCQIPAYNNLTLSEDMVDLGTETETYHQYFFAMRCSTNQAQVFAYAGAVMVEYAIDFYSARYDTAPFLREPTVEPSWSALRSKHPLAIPSPLSKRSKKYSDVVKEKKAKLKEDEDSTPSVLKTIGRSTLDSKIPKRSSSLERGSASSGSMGLGRIPLGSTRISSDVDYESCPCCGEIPCKKDRHLAKDD